MMKAKISRHTHFNAAHRLHNPSWSEKKNKDVFGKCNNANYHGHNYELIVSVMGDIDPETGFVMDVKTLEDLITQYVEKDFDHKNLNLEVPEFETLNPTVEHIAMVIWRRLRAYIPERFLFEVTLYETPRNFVTYFGP